MKILKSLDLNNVVFIDIETVAGVKQLTPDEPMWHSWDYKLKHGREPLGDTEDPTKSFSDKAALFAEFGKIVCITIGKIKDEEIILKSYSSDDEKQLLSDFCKDLDNITAANKNTVLCGHAIKGFDLPWIMRRCLVNQVELPTLIDTAHLKPWETTAVDTMDLWKGTGFNGGSLIAIAVALGLHNPKDEMEGFQTTEFYYNHKDGLELIKTYCEKDVVTVANIVRRCRYENPVTVKNNSSNKIEAEKVGILERSFNTKKISKSDQKILADKMGEMNIEDAKVATIILKASLPK